MSKKNARNAEQSQLPQGRTPPAGAVMMDDGDVDVVIALEADAEFVGEFLGSKDVRSAKFKNPEGNTLHRFRSQDGEVVGVWGAHQLDQLLSKAQPGRVYWLCQNGEKGLGNGNTMKLFQVALLPNGFPKAK